MNACQNSCFTFDNVFFLHLPSNCEKRINSSTNQRRKTWLQFTHYQIFSCKYYVENKSTVQCAGVGQQQSAVLNFAPSLNNGKTQQSSLKMRDFVFSQQNNNRTAYLNDAIINVHLQKWHCFLKRLDRESQMFHNRLRWLLKDEIIVTTSVK